MSFATLATLLASACLLLATGWLFAGDKMIRRWSREPNEIALVIGRRIGAAYLCIGLLFLAVRDSTSPELIHSLGSFAALANGVLAALGCTEFIKGRIGPAIFISIAVEVLLLAGFVQLIWF